MKVTIVTLSLVFIVLVCADCSYKTTERDSQGVIRETEIKTDAASIRATAAPIKEGTSGASKIMETQQKTEQSTTILKCPACQGTGKVEEAGNQVTCEACNGTGNN